jgi:cytochrome c oxidase assembly protein subunit 11
MRSRPTRKPINKRHLWLGFSCGALALLMVGAAFAAVPLYRAFCQATGYGGTVARSKVAPTRQVDQNLRVSFDTNVRGVPLEFTPEKPSVTVKVGATGMAYFKVTNTSDHPVTARAVYNVVPEQAGAYVRKLQCFCFNAQTLQPHQTVDFPMVFYVDPGFATDRDTKLYTDLTLSYTFYPAKPDEPASPKA